jgi:hypothetical protein
MHNLHFVPTLAVFVAPWDTPLRRAFALVDPKLWGQPDWKAPIAAVLHQEDLDAVRVSLEDVIMSIEFYTATKASVDRCPEAKDPNSFALVITAKGYRAGPAA